MFGVKRVSVQISFKLTPLRRKKRSKAAYQTLKGGKYPAYQLQLMSVSVSGS